MTPFRFKKDILQRNDLSIVWYLIAINALVFFLSAVTGGKILAYLAMTPVLVLRAFTFWTPFTYMFTHYDPMHLIFNMLALFFIGTSVERSLGSVAFLLYYLGAGLFAGVASLGAFVLLQNIYSPLIGASGAIYALLVAYACLFPSQSLYLMGLIPIRAPYLVAGYALVDIVMQVARRNTGVAHLTHLLGLAFGIAIMYFVYRINFFKTFSKR